jgi:peptidoglycan/xylan/chitin deacetylase (PgdA/CDA1 family)
MMLPLLRVVGLLMSWLVPLWLPCVSVAAGAMHEPRQRLEITRPEHARDVALTLDACGGAYDRDLIATLVRLKVPATLFVTRRWLDANPAAARELLAQAALFELENHGHAHVPAVVRASLYTLRGPATLAGVEQEVVGGAQAVERVSGRAPVWFRGAGAAYDTRSEQLITRLGYRIAGFSLNADDGATLGAAAVSRRLLRLQPGDVVIAHMNKPNSGTAKGFAAALPELLQRNLRFVKLSQVGGVQPTSPGRVAR